MTTSLLPRFTVLAESQLNHDAMHSLLISLLRGAAAIQVAAAHLRSEFYPGLRTMADPPFWYQLLAFMTGFAHQAVVVFFLISGWLVGGSLLNKIGKPHAFKLYAIDRVTRLWTVLIPTFLFMLAIGILGGAINPRAPDLSATNEFSLLTLMGNLVGLQTILLPEYGGNYPLWSLSNETWYYVLFPLALCFAAGKGWQGKLWPGVGLLAIAALLPLPMLLYFSLWLLGAGFSRVRIDCSRSFTLLTLLILVALSVYFRLYGQNDGQSVGSLLQDLLISMPLLILLSASHQRVDYSKPALHHLRRVGTVLSEFSFTLYVVHIPLLLLLRHVMHAWWGYAGIPAHTLVHLGIYCVILLGLLVFAYGFYLLFEARTSSIRQGVKELLLSRPRPVQRPA